MPIRKIKKNDIDELSELYCSVFSSQPWNEPWSVDSARARLNHFYESKGFLGFLFETENSIDALVLGNIEPFLQQGAFYLREMCVSEACRRQGVGRELLNVLHQELSALSIAQIYLITRTNMDAAKFYLSSGYQLETAEGVFEFKLD